MSIAKKTSEATQKIFKNKPIKKLLVSKQAPKVLCHFQCPNSGSYTRTRPTRSVESAQPQRKNTRAPKRAPTTVSGRTASKMTVGTACTPSASNKTANSKFQQNSSTPHPHSRGTLPDISNLSIDSDTECPSALNPRSGGVEQFYKNENFANTPHSLDKKSQLDTSQQHHRLHSVTSDTEFRKLQQFRDDNYLDCHSAISRTRSKASAIDLPGHKCSYRFYINDRLFPTPLNSDAKTLRCIQCQLPFDESQQDDSLNGIIQGKVKIEGEVKDVMMLLPVERPVVMKEKRLERTVTKDVVYFGVIKLDGSVGCKSESVSDSLALRYQKGFQWKSGNGVTESGDACDIVFV